MVPTRAVPLAYVCALFACGGGLGDGLGEGAGVGPRGLYRSVDVEPRRRAEAQGGAPTVLYLARGGATLHGGYDDARNDSSSLVAGAGKATVTVPPYGGSSSQWQIVVNCVREQFARFNVSVVDERPASGDYQMVVFGGDGSELGLGRDVGGFAPIDTHACNTVDDAVVFVFTDNFAGNLTGTCEIAAQELAHTFSLDHELLAPDAMSYLDYAERKTFTDGEAACGEYTPRACPCGRKSQSAVALLGERLGFAPSLHARATKPAFAAERPREVLHLF